MKQKQQKKNKLNWIDDGDDRRTCDYYVNKLSNSSSEKLCITCFFVQSFDSKKIGKK